MKQFYISNNAEHFSYKGGCDMNILKRLKEELAWAIDKSL